MSEVLAQIRPSAPRRLVGVVVMGGLGVLLVTLAFLRPPSALFLQLFLLALGVLALAGADILRRVTALTLELTETELRDSAGRVLTPVDQIAAVSRGVFAAKPSNGFVLRLKKSQPRAWAPGLWWRIGRRLGVGGVTPAGESRAMADIIAALITPARE